MLKAIETRYKGYRFRSRLEARWAVFFDHIGIAWQYEAEGFDLGTVRYLPDFSIPHSFPLWIEIKGGAPSLEEIHKAHQLAKQAQGNVVIACGTPGEEDIVITDGSDVLSAETTKGYPVWCDMFRHPHRTGRSCQLIHDAYIAARAARFEYGERS